ncbi:MAG: hypothetical protein Q9166_005553 [cf. Caloplaca sp. 2 TL-2023]
MEVDHDEGWANDLWAIQEDAMQQLPRRNTSEDDDTQTPLLPTQKFDFMVVQGDDSYSDDDLDALPDGTFQELQEDAFLATQQAAKDEHQSIAPLATPQKNVPGVLDRPLNRPTGTGPFPLLMSQSDSWFPQAPSSDYGDLDNDMLDGEIYDAAEESGTNAIQASRAASLPYGESAQREQWRNQRYAMPPQHLSSDVPQARLTCQTANETNGYYVKSNVSQHLISNGEEVRSSRQSDVDALNAQILELRRERDHLEKAKKAAEDAALAKSGEIAIIRANQNRSERAYESKMQALQKLHFEEVARQQLEVERALAEKQKITTEKGFLQNDLAEGNEQIRSLQRAVKAKVGTSKTTSDKDGGRPGLPSTPKKNKSLSHGDGFEDDELQLASPSKLPYRSKTSTPKAGNKRKRKPALPSPIKPLQLVSAKEAPDRVDLSDNTPVQPVDTTTTAFPAATTRLVTVLPDDRFELTQHVMNHRMDMNGKRTFEVLSDLAYPSKPDTALSTIFLDKTSAVIISMWKQCVDEKFVPHVRSHCDLGEADKIPITTGPSLVDTLVAVIQSTADVNIVPRVRRQPQEHSSLVNTFDCLDLLQSVANDCLLCEEDIIRFWKCMRFDFIIMVLNITQPIEELHLAIGLLRTSVQKDTFAMTVPPNDGKQEPSEMRLIDFVTRPLVENLQPPKDEAPYSVVEVAKLRLHVLSLMEDMCDNKHSSRLLACCPYAIGRLVWVMNDELDAVYDYQYGHEHRAELVNQATRLLFRLRIDYPQLISMQEKLKVIPNSGGVHKHLIALTRLALSEGVFFEEEIEDDVVECAFEMLEDLSSPEEAEALREAFSTARSR